MDERFLQGLAAAVVVHGALAYALVRLPDFNRKHAPTVIEMAIKQRRLEPQKIEVTPPPKPPEPPKPVPPPKHVHKPPPPEPPKAPPPNETPKEPPKEPPKPVFGLSASSTAENGVGITAPVGNTTVADPHGPRGPVAPLGPPPPQAAPAPVFKAASPLYIKDYPEEDVDACSLPKSLYPQELREQGVQGKTLVRLEVDDKGHIHSARAIKGPAKQLNEIAEVWLKTHCHFKPAVATDGKYVAATIVYTVTWEIEN